MKFDKDDLNQVPRRQFFEVTGGLSVSALLASAGQAFPQNKDSSQKIRMGVVGGGFWLQLPVARASPLRGHGGHRPATGSEGQATPDLPLRRRLRLAGNHGSKRRRTSMRWPSFPELWITSSTPGCVWSAGGM